MLKVIFSSQLSSELNRSESSTSFGKHGCSEGFAGRACIAGCRAGVQLVEAAYGHLYKSLSQV